MERIWLRSYPPDVPHEIAPDSLQPLPDLLMERAARYADRRAFSSFGTHVTYAEFVALSDALAAWLQNRAGLKKGDRIAIMLPNLVQQPVAVTAALRLGLVIVNINPLYTPRELKHQLGDAGVQAIIIWDKVSAALGAIIGETSLNCVIVTGTTDLLTPDPPAPAADAHLGPYVAFTDALSEGRDLPWTPAQVDVADPAFLQYTGGTTGLSKGAVLTHANMSANMRQTLLTLQGRLDDEGQVIITALPLYHIFALTVNFLCCFDVGGTNVLIANPRDFPGFVQELGRWRFNFITGVNTLYNALLNTPGFDALDFSALHTSIAGGMAMHTAVAERWQRVTGCFVNEGYGLSETSPVLCVNLDSSAGFTGSIGLPVPSTDICIRDEQGNDVPYGQPGELCARGPQVMSGYWGNESATRQVMTADGFFRTGDIAIMDERGFVRIIDRKKDMILVSGFNVYPNEVEEVAAEMDGVLECACVGSPDPDSGECVTLFVVAQPGAGLAADQVRAWCRERLAPYKVPARIRFIPELPKSTVGKILRRELRTLAGTDDAPA